jgi:hypothetical protein
MKFKNIDHPDYIGMVFCFMNEMVCIAVNLHQLKE